MFSTRSIVLRQAFAASQVYSRSVSSTTSRWSNGSTRHENNPDVLKKGKESVLRKNKKDSKEEPRWREELASDAEAFVKATRGEIELRKDHGNVPGYQKH